MVLAKLKASTVNFIQLVFCIMDTDLKYISKKRFFNKFMPIIYRFLR